MKFLIVFIVLSVINVIFSTIRSITTIKSGKLVASVISGGYFAFYNVMLIYTVAEFPMWQKCVITFVCNVLGVYLVKWIEEKMQKDKLWIIHATATERLDNVQKVYESLKGLGIKSIYTEIVKNELYSLEIFSYTQKESEMIKGILDNYNIKYCATETKPM